MKLLLVDLSSLFRPIWEMSGQEADQDHASRATVGAIHTMAHGYDGVAICCDSPKSWRKEFAPTYKANRPASDEPMLHQLRLAQEQLRRDGFPVWQADGFEADDVIASAVEKLFHALDRNADCTISETEIVIASSDKDLFQLVCSNVKMKPIRGGELYDSAGVKAKLGVSPEQVRDWLCLVGDSSDNVAGVKGIGPKRATELLQTHGSLANLYSKLGESCAVLNLTPSMFTNLKEGLQSAELARKLITLRADVVLPFEEIFKPRVPQNIDAEFEQEDDDMAEVIDNESGEVKTEEKPSVPPPPQQDDKKDDAMTDAAPAPTALIVAPAEWTKGLEPRSYGEAAMAARHMYASRLFSKYGTPQAVLAVILAGRELGIGVMASLRGFHIIDGKPSMSASLMAALVLRSGKAKQFEIIERTNARATIRVWRVGEDKPQDVSYSVEDAKLAGLVKPGGGWVKSPADMCVARCKAIGARLKWDDVVGGMYTPEELGREDLEVAA